LDELGIWSVPLTNAVMLAVFTDGLCGRAFYEP
jgi:hypothetical protein